MEPKKITILVLVLLAAFAGWKLTAEPGVAGGSASEPLIEGAVDGVLDGVLDGPGVAPVQHQELRFAVVQEPSDSAEEEAASAPPPRLTVAIRDPSGTPLDGADIRLVAQMNEGSGLFEFQGLPLGEQQAAVPTGSPGLYGASIRSDEVYLVVARAAGFATVERGGCAAGELVEITLTRGAALKGLVVDAETQLPVVGATARAFHGDPERYEETLTGDGGGFLFQGLMPGEVSYVVIPRLHAAVRYSTVEIEAGEIKELRFEVDPIGTITGQITDASTGLPIETAEVALSPYFNPGQAVEPLGRYVLGCSQNSACQVTARAPGYAPCTVQFEAADETLDIQLGAERRFRGRIVDTQGAPVEDAFVGVRGFDGAGWHYLAYGRPIMANMDGEFSVGRLRGNGYVTISAGAPGYAPSQVTVQMAQVSFRDREAELAPLVLVPAASLAGRVLTEGGDPVSGARVYAQKQEAPLPPGEFRASDRRMAYCTPDGAFTLRGLSKGTWNGRVMAPGNATLTLSFEMAAGEQRTDVVWTVEGAGTSSLVGLVTGPNGAPLEKAFVSLRPTPTGGGLESLLVRIEPVSTDAAGRFEFGQVPDADYRLHVSPPESGRREWKWRDPDVETLLPASLEGVRPDGRLVELQLQACTSSVAGRVTDGNGNGVPMAFVCVDLGSGPSYHGTLADADGAFDLAVSAGRSFKLSVWRTGALESKVGNRRAIEVELGRAILSPLGEPNGRAVAASGSRGVIVRL